MTPDVVVLGNLLVDDVVFADGSSRMGQPGGAVLYAALGARLWNVATGCVSVRGDDYPGDMLDRLQDCGVDLAGVQPLRRPGVRTWLLYEGQVRHLVHRLGCPSHEDVSPRPQDIPSEWRMARAFHLAPMPFTVQRALLASLMSTASQFVSVDPHLPITDDTLTEWRAALARADACFASEDELLFEHAGSDPGVALAQLASGRLRFVALKRGENGGILYDARDRRSAFYRRSSGLRVDRRVDSIADLAAAVDAHFRLGLGTGVLVANPIPAPAEMPRDQYDQALQSALPT